jgi:hypothetical protein
MPDVNPETPLKLGPEKLIRLVRKEFTEAHLNSLIPILITDGLSEWPAMERWDPAELHNHCKGNVNVSISHSGVWRYKPDGTPSDPASQYVIPNLPFSEAVELIKASKPGDPKYYITQANVAETLPSLIDDLRFPDVARALQPNLWFGSAGTVTSLHFDGANNLFAQVYGTKEFLLAAPEDSQFLYPYPKDCIYPGHCYINLEEPDRKCFPLLSKAELFSVTIYPGQMLFLPAYWYHHVRSTGVSISVNRWLGTRLLHQRGPWALWQSRSSYKRDKWASFLHSRSLKSLIGLARELADTESPLAILVVRIALDKFLERYESYESGGGICRSLSDQLSPLVSAMLEEEDDSPRTADLMPVLDLLEAEVKASRHE